MLLRSNGDGAHRRRSPVAASVLFAASVALLSACASGGEGPDRTVAPEPVSSTTQESTTVPPPASTSRQAPPPLVPPTAIASVPPSAPVYTEVPTVPSGVGNAYYPPPDPCVGCTGETEPSTPAAPPPKPVDSRGFPLGTVCGQVSCTSPDGVTFVNPDAVPNLGNQRFDLCDHTYCPPPGLQIIPGQLPSTGSSGGGPS